MTKAKLKSFLISEVEKINDFETLRIMQTILETRKIIVPEMTEEQNRIIKESEEIMKKGKF